MKQNVLLHFFQFKLMENVAFFLTAAQEYGCPRGDLFQSADLEYGKHNILFYLFF
jgi:hypothetical protein